MNLHYCGHTRISSIQKENFLKLETVCNSLIFSTILKKVAVNCALPDCTDFSLYVQTAV